MIVQGYITIHGIDGKHSTGAMGTLGCGWLVCCWVGACGRCWVGRMGRMGRMGVGDVGLSSAMISGGLEVAGGSL